MESSHASDNMKKLILLFAVIAFYVIATNLTPPTGLTPTGWKSIILMICAVIVWVSEVIPLGISSCLFIFMPQFLHIDTTRFALENFAIATIFFILSAVIIAAVFVKVGLGKRIALYITCIFGSRSSMVLLSFMLCGCLISMVLVDIPTAIILGGVAYPLLQENGCMPGKSNFGRLLMMGIPIAAAIGGLATPAGSGLNVLTVNLVHKATGIQISFLDWTAVGFPLSLILIALSWFILLKIYPPEISEVKGLENVKRQRQELGPLTKDEKKFLVVFGLVLILWFTQSLTGIQTAFSSLIGSTLFFMPGINLATWKRSKEAINWESLLLIGSSASLAMVLHHQGGAAWLSDLCLSGFANSSLFTLLLVVTAFGIFSHLLVPVANAVLCLVVPIVGAMALQLGINPLYLTLPLGFTASAVLILPLDPVPLTTYGYKYWKLWHMSIPGTIISVLWIPICAVLMMAAIQLGVF